MRNIILYHISNKSFLDESYKEESMGVTAAANTSSLK